jgi:hypothetical protein
MAWNDERPNAREAYGPELSPPSQSLPSQSFLFRAATVILVMTQTLPSELGLSQLLLAQLPPFKFQLEARFSVSANTVELASGCRGWHTLSPSGTKEAGRA